MYKMMVDGMTWPMLFVPKLLFHERVLSNSWSRDLVDFGSYVEQPTVRVVLRIGIRKT